MIGRIFGKILKGADQVPERTLSEIMKSGDEGVQMGDAMRGAPDVNLTPDVEPSRAEPPPEPPMGEEPPMGAEPPMGGEPPVEPPTEPPPGVPPGGDMVPPQPPVVPPGPGIEIPPTVGGSTRKLPNTKYFTDPDTVEVIDFVNKAQTLREGKSWKETTEAAKIIDQSNALGLKPPNERWTGAEVKALDMSIDRQGKLIKRKSVEFHKQVQSGEPLSAAQTAEMQQLLDRLAATNQLRADVSHEAAQMLNALKIPTDSDYSMARAIAKLSADGGGPSNMALRVQSIAEAQTDKDILQAANEGWAAKTWKGLMTFRYNMMLSSIRSHMANILGSASAGMYETLVVRNLAAVNSMIEGAVTLSPRAITFGDNWQAFTNSVMSSAQAFKLAKDIAAGKTTPEQSGKFLTELGMRVKPIRSMIDPTDPSAGTHPLTPIEKARLIGEAPTRLLEAEDAFFRTVFYNQELSAQASRKARMAHPDDATARQSLYDNLMINPPDDIRESALRYSQKLTFTNDPSIYGKFLGAAAKKFIAAQQDIPGMQLLAPFVRTPANILSYSMEQLGMQQAIAPMQTWKQLTGSDKALRAEALARIEAATGIMALTYWMVNEGMLTGIGSTDMSMRRMYESQGWKMNSWRFGDQSIELSRFDPLGLMLGIAASGWEVAEEMGNTGDSALAIVSGSILSMSELMLDRSYLSSFGEFFGAMTDGAKGMKPFLSTGTSIASSFMVPGIARDFREMTDEYRREMSYPMTTGGLFNRILMQVKNGYPIASQGLANAVDVRGELIVNGGNSAVRGLLPIRVGNIRPDPVLKELMSNGLVIRKPKEFAKFPAGAGKLGLNLLQFDPSGRIYAEYQAAINQAGYNAAKQVVESGSYKKAFEAYLDPEAYEKKPRIGEPVLPSYGTPESDAAKAIRAPMAAAREAAHLMFLQSLTKKEIDSKLMPGEKVPVPNKMVEITSQALRPLILKMRRNEKIEFEEIPGLQIRPSGGKNIPKMIAPEF